MNYFKSLIDVIYQNSITFYTSTKRNIKIQMENKHNCKLQSSDSWIKTNFVDKVHIPLIFRKLFILSGRNAKNTFHYRSKSALRLEKERQLKLPYFIIHPYSPFILVWDIWMTLLYLFSFVFIPFEACNLFYTQINPNNFVNYGVIVITVHTFFILDIIIIFFTGFIEPVRKTVCLDRRKIAWRYFSSYLIPDVLATTVALLNAIPLYFLTGKAIAPRIIILNLVKLIRIITMIKLWDKLATQFGVYGIPFKIMRFIILSLYFFHCIACLIFILPFTISTVTTYSYNSWIHTIYSDLSNYPYMKFYLASLFTSINLALSCSATTRAETMADFCTAIFYACLGIMYTCFLFVQILDIVRTIMEPETKYDEFITQLRDYMCHNQLPVNVQQRMYLFYEHRYQRTYFREKSIRNTLSYNLSKDIDHYGVYKMMSKVKIFQNLDPAVLEGMLDDFVLKIYLPKDIIIKSRALNRFVYFINYGTVAAYTVSGEEVKHIYDGDFFGTESLLMKDSKSNVHAISVDISEVYLLDGDVFTKALKTNPDLYDEVLDISKNRIKIYKAAEAKRRQSFDHEIPKKSSEISVQLT